MSDGLGKRWDYSGWAETIHDDLAATPELWVGFENGEPILVDSTEKGACNRQSYIDISHHYDLNGNPIERTVVRYMRAAPPPAVHAELGHGDRDVTAKAISNLVEALDDVEATDEEARDTCERLGIDVPAWAAEIRQKVAAATAPTPPSSPGAELDAYLRAFGAIGGGK